MPFLQRTVAPRHILPMCCHRLILLDPRHAQQDAAWQELPDRHMVWAPTHNQSTGEWRPEWICFRCNATVQPDHTLLQSVPPTPACPEHGTSRRRSCDGWCPAPSPKSCQRFPTSVPNRINLPCPPGQEQGPSSTHSWPLPKPTRPAPFCRSMVSARMTQSPAPACCKGYSNTCQRLLARLWYGRPSEYVWHDQHNQPHTVTQAEGGEQGDPLMPVLFSLGAHPAEQR